MIITRGLQEWACLLPQELPFASVARLHGWHTHEAQILGETTLRSLVRSHGQIIRQAEQAEVTALLTQDDLTALDLQLAPRSSGPATTARACLVCGWPRRFGSSGGATVMLARGASGSDNCCGS
jgi:hypothetical protein